MDYIEKCAFTFSLVNWFVGAATNLFAFATDRDGLAMVTLASMLMTVVGPIAVIMLRLTWKA